MYIPKNKYKIKQALEGDFIRPDGSSYRGFYIEVANGSFYEGSSLSGPALRIFPSKTEDINTVQRPYNDYYGPTEKDYTNGFFVRYFIRDKRNGKFTEVSKNQWNEKKSLTYVTAGSIAWLLTGPVEDGKINGIPYKGITTRNSVTLQSLEKQFPGISNFFDNPAEFVR